MWLRQPRHRSLLKSDLVVAGILTLVTMGLCVICTVGTKYFVMEGLKVGISSYWTEGVITFFLTVIILGYTGTLYLIMRDHVVPWYRWWNRCVVIKLVLEPRPETESGDRAATDQLCDTDVRVI